MPGRHKTPKRTRSVRRWLTAVAAFAVAGATVFFPAFPASAATTVNSQLSLTGLASADNPVGGSVIGIHPGDSVSFKTASVPTAGLDKLGLGGLLGGLLNSVLGFQSSANFAELPGGKANTVVGTNKAVSFSFPKAGTYNFTWEVQGLHLLGGAQTINLDGNALAKAGVKLNAHNEYVGKIVVADDPPKGGISIQLPKGSVQPEVGPVKVPKVQIPGVTTPTIQNPVGNLLPDNPITGSKPGSGKPGSGKPGADTGTTYTPPGLTVPDQVVPQDIGGVSGGGGFYGSNLPVTGSNPNTISPIFGNASDKAAGKSSADLPQQNSNGKNKSIDLAASNASPSGALPVVLAIVAIIALALVAGTYARLYLLKNDA